MFIVSSHLLPLLIGFCQLVRFSGSSGSSKSSSSGAVKEGQAVAADAPGLATVLAKLLCTLLPALQVPYTHRWY